MGDGTGCPNNGSGDQVITATHLFTTVLEYLHDNGGDSQSHALQANSPAIDQIPAGSNDCGGTIDSDQRGISRPQNGSCDIGAFEKEAPTRQQINLQLGWNFKALAVEQAALTAQGVCDEIDTQSGSLAEVDRWHNGGWDGHLCDQPFNEFELQVGNGYFMRANQASTWTIQALTITTPISFTRKLGWNTISLPHTDAYTAESLCDEIINQGVTTVEIDRWYNGGGSYLWATL